MSRSLLADWHRTRGLLERLQCLHPPQLLAGLVIPKAFFLDVVIIAAIRTFTQLFYFFYQVFCQCLTPLENLDVLIGTGLQP